RWKGAPYSHSHATRGNASIARDVTRWDHVGSPADTNAHPCHRRLLMNRPRVLLADDHTLVLEAFSGLLADDCDIVGTASNGKDLLTAAGSLAPDVVVVDVTMPVMNGIDAARQLKRDHPEIRIIVLTMSEDRQLAL